MNGKEEKINKHAKLIRRHFLFHFIFNIKARNGNKAQKEDYKTN